MHPKFDFDFEQNSFISWLVLAISLDQYKFSGLDISDLFLETVEFRFPFGKTRLKMGGETV
jgi:hypothetical protein